MARERKHVCPPKGAPPYMNTYGDMVTLLLTFFVLLLSMASFEPVKFIQAMQAIQGGFGILESFPTIAINPLIKTPKYGTKEKLRKESMDDVEKMRETLKKSGLEEAVKVKVTETGVAVMLQDPVGFRSGDAELSPSSRQALEEVVRLLEKNPQAQVRVEGHTDDVPIHSARYPSNWDLSSARALNVVKFLAERSKLNPAGMSAVGYGEHRPLAPNVSNENRSKNRRIEIYLDYTQKEGR